MLSSRRFPRVRVVAAVFIGSIGLAVVHRAATSPVDAPSEAGLAATEPSHDFGTVNQGEVLHHRFVLVNRTSHAIRIQSIDPQCTCTTVDKWPRSLAAGESGEVAITIETARFSGPIAKAVHVISSEPTIRILEVTANVWTPIAVSSPAVIFPAATDPTKAASRTVTLRNQRRTTVTLGPVRSNNPRFKTTLHEVEPGRVFELTIETVPPLPDGTHSAQITVGTSDVALPEVKIDAVATVLPAVQIVPQAFTFDAARLSSSEKRFAVVLNHRRRDLRVSDVTTNAPGVELTTTASPDQKQVTITLSFPAGFEPARGLWLRGKTNDATLPTFEVPIVPAAGH